jgi:hypothetical protein
VETVPYVVRHGDHLHALAARFGFDADEAWNDPSNDALRTQGRSAHMLVANDVLFIPAPRKRTWLPATIGTTNSFTATLPTVDLTIALRLRGAPLANEKCVVELQGRVEMTSDSNGSLALKVPATMRTVVVEIPRLGVSEVFGVGHLDPPTTPSGLRQRLANLDHGAFGASGLHLPDRLSDAISAFQKSNGLDVTGIADAATVDKIVEVHGC